MKDTYRHESLCFHRFSKTKNKKYQRNPETVQPHFRHNPPRRRRRRRPQAPWELRTVELWRRRHRQLKQQPTTPEPHEQGSCWTTKRRRFAQPQCYCSSCGPSCSAGAGSWEETSRSRKTARETPPFHPRQRWGGQWIVLGRASRTSEQQRNQDLNDTRRRRKP